jgi:HAD superfamily hydrolase (TIGR01509 family)
MGEYLFVWLDAMGVIFESADDARDLLVPFAQRQGSRLDRDAIVDEYRTCSLGRFSSAELWQRLGVSGDAEALDASHLEAHRLTPGIADFLQHARDAGVRVGCVSNDVSEWARWLRARHALDALVSPWITSGDVMARKPDVKIYAHLESATGLAPDRCVIVDDREPNLDAAAGLGFTTVRFGDSSARHRSVADAAALTRLLIGDPR